MRKLEKAGWALLGLALISAVLVAATSPSAGNSCKGYIALTFDDGPSATTPRLLSQLRDYGMPAVFFDVGAHEQEFPAQVRQEALQGQAENHSYSHPFLTLLTYPQIYSQLLGTNQITRELTGSIPQLFRPPFDRISPDVEKAQAALGLLTALWNIDSQDYNPGATVKNVEARTWNAKAGDVILFHDGPSVTLQALPAILSHYRSEGLCGGALVPSSEPHFAWHTRS